MNSSKANSIFNYIVANIETTENLNKGLKEIKTKLVEDSRNLDVFRKCGLTSLMFKVLRNKDERVLKWVLSIFTSCLIEKKFQEEVSICENGISSFVEIIKKTKCKILRHRACKVIGQQSSHEPSCNLFRRLNTVEYVVCFLKEAESDEGKETAIKTLRCLINHLDYCDMILRENRFFIVCSHGLSSGNLKLSRETLKFIVFVMKTSSSSFFSQLMRGTRSLQVLTKLYELGDDADKDMIRCILLSVFRHHAYSRSYHEYKSNCIVLDDLCMAKLPQMIASELKSETDKKQLTVDESNLLVTLCKFCELGQEWKRFSNNVLPSYHERVWMQLQDFNGVSLLISFMSSQKHDLRLLQTVLRAVLGLEYLHSNREKIIYRCLECKLLPLLAELFDMALKEICDSNNNNDFATDTVTTSAANTTGTGTIILKTSCHHSVTKTSNQKRASFSKEVSRDLLDLLEPSHSGISQQGFTKNVPISPPKISTVSYKTINKIKFRTGKKRIDTEEEDKKRRREGTDDEDQDPLRSPNKASLTVVGESREKYYKHREARNHDGWLHVLECIIRLLQQVVSVIKDISSLCRQFLMMIFYYIRNSPVVHPSALKLLASIAKNSSSIQYTLDIMLIPKLAVDLADRTCEDCSQCVIIQDGVRDYLLQCQGFFNHFHQYGRCEVANRLNPSKPETVKHSCVVALAHVVKCPHLLQSFLLNHKGLEYLIELFNLPVITHRKMHMYAIVSLSNIAQQLEEEYSNKNKYSCLCCTRNICSLKSFDDFDQGSMKKQIIQLTKLKKNICSFTNFCLIDMETEKNFTFILGDKILKVNKEKLTFKNEVMRAMIQGFFRESTKDCFHVKQFDSAAMEMVIHFVYGCSCGIFCNEDINVYIELLSLADMYFVPELQVLAIHYISNLLDTDDIFRLVEHLINYVDFNLIRHLVCSSVMQRCNIRCKEKWINQFLESSLKDCFLEHIYKGFTSLLEPTITTLCNCDDNRNYL